VRPNVFCLLINMIWRRLQRLQVQRA